MHKLVCHLEALGHRLRHVFVFLWFILTTCNRAALRQFELVCVTNLHLSLTQLLSFTFKIHQLLHQYVNDH